MLLVLKLGLLKRLDLFDVFVPQILLICITVSHAFFMSWLLIVVKLVLAFTIGSL